MPRREREDERNSIHHVFNRALARRTMFESRDEFRFFLSLLARTVHRKEIDVFAYCLLHTHYHAIIRVRDVGLSGPMQRIQTTYSRFFNRRHRRDGPLMRGRFSSRRIKSSDYLTNALIYVEANGFEAHLANSESAYEFGSASRRHETPPPRWLSAIRSRVSVEENDRESIRFIIEQRIQAQSRDRDDDMPPPLSPAVIDWMRKKRELADGKSVPLAVCHPREVLETAQRHLHSQGSRWLRLAGGEHHLLRDIEATLIARLCGLRQVEVAQQLEISQSSASAGIRKIDAMCDAHPQLEREFAILAAAVVHASSRDDTAGSINPTP